MGLEFVLFGKNLLEEINVIIEILKDLELVKYEVDKEIGVIFVDCILFILMCYLCNYGYVLSILCGDGDLVDVLVVLLLLLVLGLVVCCCLVGVLKMSDEVGSDEKILVVLVLKIFSGYVYVEDIVQVLSYWLECIGYFFEYYKDLEKGKWVKLDGWGGVVEVKQILIEVYQCYFDSKV